jgi:hypothetical protein
MVTVWSTVAVSFPVLSSATVIVTVLADVSHVQPLPEGVVSVIVYW